MQLRTTAEEGSRKGSERQAGERPVVAVAWLGQERDRTHALDFRKSEAEGKAREDANR